MAYTFLHMGCNQRIAREVISEIEGIRILDSMYAGLKLEAEEPEAQAHYFRIYYAYERQFQEDRQIQHIDESLEGK